MRPLSVQEIINWLGDQYIAIEPQGGTHDLDSLSSVLITGISTDTRTLKPGEMFIALRGERFDGHEFCKEAVSKGSPLLMIDLQGRDKLGEELRDFPKIVVKDTLTALGKIAKGYRESYLNHVKVIALTGSIGKTSTKYWLKAVGEKLLSKDEVIASMKSYNNEIGVPLTLLTAPESVSYMILEFGARKRGDIRYLSDIAKPDVGALRSIAPVHLETFGSLKGIAQEKASLLEIAIRSGGIGLAPRKLKRYLPLTLLREKNLFLLPSPKVRTRVEPETLQTSIKLTIPLREETITFKGTLPSLIPRFQLENLSFALQLWDLLGLSPEKELLAELLNEDLRKILPEMRTEPTFIGDILVINDAYNSNPWGLREAINFILSIPKYPRGAVIGDMLELGKWSKRYHKWIAKHLRALDRVWLYGDEVRHTWEALGNEKASYFRKEQREELKERIKEAVKRGEVKLLLFKGSRALRLEEILNSVVMEVGER